ncbi:tRNA (cytidine(34)-2'-O)-methyltransferase [Notoacmeibacter sp. MSK16QG-6]|uniref:tRNA (cytidine(34)-2'-O)-methyltransferase n=1 Tax=Notoacmeibacter sp. MSK16QG-6 TaxID=2957982 RepID=UPI00209F89EE|nr:tRNA (cytidine(34)-2'-O)-methyltransferase [Notoacmeibacter sp. MSK16QG-6]MCP1199886.1 tRNA (cytidine(34)-2'-O)-methyltransferase [Notoacmeibacter sp. MSK16QG-6]
MTDDFLPPAGKPLIALYQPDIPGNTGTILRMGACLDLPVAVIGPAGFDLSDRALKRSGMDYLEKATLSRFDDWAAFEAWRASEGRRLVLLTTKADTPYHGFDWRADDIALFGRESAGVPDHVHDAADERLTIPMRNGARSLNLAISAAMVAGELARRLSTP